jgi:hypothetical protein
LSLHTLVLRLVFASCDICVRVPATSKWMHHPFLRPRAKAKRPLPLKEFARVLNEYGVEQNKGLGEAKREYVGLRGKVMWGRGEVVWSRENASRSTGGDGG